MSAKPSDMSDDDLLAYLDGALAPDRAAAVELWLAADPEARARLEEWRRQNALLAQLYGPAASEPVPERLNPHRIAAGQRAAGAGWLRLAAAAVVCLALGASGGWYAARQGLPAAGPGSGGSMLIATAVAAHRLYTPEVLHPVEVKGNPDDHLGRWLSKRLDRRLVIPDLSGTGWTLVGGSLLPAGAGPAAQIMYEDGQGRRITLFVTPTDGASRAPRFARSGNLEALSWTDAMLACTIVGPVDRDTLKRLAGRVYEQLT